MAHSCPRSCTRRGCYLLAIRHPCPLCRTSSIPARGSALSGAALSSPADIPLASPGDGYLLPAAMHSLRPPPLRQPASRFTDLETANSSPCLGLLPLRKPASLFADLEMA